MLKHDAIKTYEVMFKLHIFISLTLDGVAWSVSHCGRFIPALPGADKILGAPQVRPRLTKRQKDRPSCQGLSAYKPKEFVTDAKAHKSCFRAVILQEQNWAVSLAPAV